MLMIRFMRIGRRNQPSFKIVVTEKTKSSTGGRFVEEVGFYNPVTKEKIMQAERIRYWISQGAQPTPTISNLLISEKVTEGEKIPKHKKSKKKEEAAASAAAPTAQAQLIEPEGSSDVRPEDSVPREPERPAQTAPETPVIPAQPETPAEPSPKEEK